MPSFPSLQIPILQKILAFLLFSPQQRGLPVSKREKANNFYGFNISISLPFLVGTVFVMPDNTELHFLCKIWIGDWLEDFALGDACRTQGSVFFVLRNNTLLERGLPSAWELGFSCFSRPANSTEEYPSESQLSIKKKPLGNSHVSWQVPCNSSSPKSHPSAGADVSERNTVTHCSLPSLEN